MASTKNTLRSKGAPAKENATKLEETLNLFKTDRFDAGSYVQSKCSLNEKEISHFCTYLVDLKKASAEEMRRSVYANYTAFIRTSREISDLEGELVSIRNLLSTQATLIHDLADGVNINSNGYGFDGQTNAISNSEKKFEYSDLERWLAEYPDLLDVLLAERRVDDALKAFNEGESVLSEAMERKSLKPDTIFSLQAAIASRKQKLADQLAEAACQSSSRGAELRAAIAAIKELGDGPRAHNLLLSAHFQRYQNSMQAFRPSNSSYGGAYTAALAQLVFSTIAQAASDSLAIFGKEPSYMSELVIWATKQTESFAELVKRHALASSAAAGGLRAAAECVQIAIGHGSLLEARGLSLCPVLVRLFKPSIKQAVHANLKRIEESTAALAAADDWVPTSSADVTRQSARVSGTSISTSRSNQYRLTSSAHRFNVMVQNLFDDVGPLMSMELGSQTLEGVYQVFNSYVSMLIKALPNAFDEEADQQGVGNKIIRVALNESQQLALLANAYILAEELLPRAAMKLSPGDHGDDHHARPSDGQTRNPEQRVWKRRLVSSVDRLKISFAQQHALDLIFTDEDSNLNASMYINMEGSEDEELSPSPIFQELVLKLSRMGTISAEMFEGRERYATLISMKLMETVIVFMAQDQSFWDDINDRPLGPLGLQQLYLDMKFVIFASQGRYLSRNVKRVVNEIISKAMQISAAVGVDPNRVLGDKESWFDDICQETLEKLSGNPRMDDEDRETYSPTASVSAQSVSSVKSHGSS